MNKLKKQTLPKIETFAQEEHGVFFSSSHLKFLAMVRAKLPAFLSNKKKSERSLPKGMLGVFFERKMKKMMAPPSGGGGGHKRRR